MRNVSNRSIFAKAAVSLLFAGVLIGESDLGFQKLSSTPDSEDASQLQFVDAQFGWIATLSGLWSTTDGGRSWRRFPTPSRASGLRLHSFYFTSRTDGWIRLGLEIHRTQNGGMSWSKVMLPHKLAGDSGSVVCVFFAGSTAWVGGGTYRPIRAGEIYFDNSAVDQTSGAIRVLEPILFKSSNSGRTWQRAAIRAEGYRVRFITFAGRNGFAASERSLLVTSDAGEHWVEAVIPEIDRTEGSIARLFALGEKQYWLSFDDNHLFKSSDAGHSWFPLGLSNGVAGLSSHGPVRLFFTNTNNGLAVDYVTGALLRTMDGGRTWADVALGFPVQDLFVLDGRNAWLTGAHGVYRVVSSDPQ